MAETLQAGLTTGPARPQTLVRAAQVAREADVQQSPNGVRWATFGETGVPVPDLDRMLEAVPRRDRRIPARQHLLLRPAGHAGTRDTRTRDRRRQHDPAQRLLRSHHGRAHLHRRSQRWCYLPPQRRARQWPARRLHQHPPDGRPLCPQLRVLYQRRPRPDRRRRRARTLRRARLAAGPRRRSR